MGELAEETIDEADARDAEDQLQAAVDEFALIHRKPLVDPKVLLLPPTVSGWVETPRESYHKDRTAVNYSSLKHIRKSGWAFYNQFFLDAPSVPTASQKFGTLAHMAILEGSKFKERYVVMPEFWGYTQKGERTNSANCKEVQEKKAAWLADLGPDKEVMTEEERWKLLNMINSILKHPKARRLLEDGFSEPIGYFVDPVTGLRCRINPDFINTKFKAFIDVKTTTDCTEWEFMNQAYRLMYPMQLAYYDKGIQQIMNMELENRAWMVVESGGTFEVAVHEASPKTMSHGRYEVREAMGKLKTCIEQNEWPRYEPVDGPAESPKGWDSYYEMRGVID